MSLRSTLTKIADSLSFVPRMTWATAAAAVGLMAVSATGCGGCDSSSLQPCPPSVGTGVCICDGLGCRPANQELLDGGAGGGTTTGGGGNTTGTGGTGGAAACDSSETACPCDANGTCPSGEVCIDDLCIVGCNFSYECGAGNVCANGACVPGCATSQPCPAGYACTNGACQIDPANPQCSTATPCPSPEICTNGVCGLQCTSSSQCAEGDICDGASHTCITDPSPKPVCSTSMPCPSGEVCLADGFCHYPCTTTAQCLLIDQRFSCSAGYCKTQQEIDPQCTLTMPCPAGKSCISNMCY